MRGTRRVRAVVAVAAIAAAVSAVAFASSPAMAAGPSHRAGAGTHGGVTAARKGSRRRAARGCGSSVSRRRRGRRSRKRRAAARCPQVHKGQAIASDTTADGPFPPSDPQPVLDQGDPAPDPLPIPIGRFIPAPPQPALDPPPPTEGVVPEEEPALFAAGRRTPRAHTAGSVGDVSLVRNLSLKTASGMPVSSTLEPVDGSEGSVATNGKGIVLYTTNVSDAISFNGGRSFIGLNPRTVFRTLAGGFCCDQVVTYIPKYDRFVWVLQYQRGVNGVKDDTSPNAIRVATATSAQLAASATANWTSNIWAPSSFGLKPAVEPRVWLDRPHVAFTSNMLYFTVGAFDHYNNKDIYTWTMAWRLKLKQLPSLSWDYLRLPNPYRYDQGRLVSTLTQLIPAQNAPDQNGVYGFYQYFAQLKNTSMLNVYEWAECCKPSAAHEVKVPSVATTDTTSAAGDDPDWLSRHGTSVAQPVTGAYTGGLVWFAWPAGRSAKQQSGPDIKIHDQPVIEAVGIDPAKYKQWVGYAKIEYKDFATALPQLRGDSSGDLAIAFAFGGGGFPPAAAVGFLGNKGYAAAVTVAGQGTDSGVTGPVSGDYFGLALDPEQPHCFVAANSATKDGAPGTAQPKNYYDPHYAVFGRAASACKTPEYVKAFGRVKVSTTMTISHAARSQAGGRMMIAGAILPAVAKAVVSIVYGSPDGRTFSQGAVTDAQGNFSDSIVPAANQTGDWNVRASWAGNSDYLASDSGAAQTVTVTPAPPPPPPPPGGPQPSQISLTCPATAAFTDTITWSGTITPSRPNVVVTINYTAPNGATGTDTTTTDAQSNYTDTVLAGAADRSGNWTSQSSWAGDASYQPATSPSCTTAVS